MNRPTSHLDLTHPFPTPRRALRPPLHHLHARHPLPPQLLSSLLNQGVDLPQLVPRIKVHQPALLARRVWPLKAGELARRERERVGDRGCACVDRRCVSSQNQTFKYDMWTDRLRALCRRAAKGPGNAWPISPPRASSCSARSSVRILRGGTTQVHQPPRNRRYSSAAECSTTHLARPPRPRPGLQALLASRTRPRSRRTWTRRTRIARSRSKAT